MKTALVTICIGESNLNRYNAFFSPTSEMDMLLRDCELSNIANRGASNHSSNSELIFMLDSSSSDDEKEGSSSSSEEDEAVEPSSQSTVWCIDSENENSDNEFAE